MISHPWTWKPIQELKKEKETFQLKKPVKDKGNSENLHKTNNEEAKRT